MGRQIILIAGLVIVAGACSPQDSASSEGVAACTPKCAGRACGDDGCGGTCGSCSNGALCNVAGACVADCTKSCGALGLTCGQHCGVSCGTCPAGASCDAGRCTCAPQCDGKSCTDADGCGGTCGPCPSEVSCTDCWLKLVVVDRVKSNGRTTQVVLAIDYAPPAGAALPTLADLHLTLAGPAKLEQVGIGEPLTSAGKKLYPNPNTGHVYQVLPDGTIRLLVMSTANSKPIGPGRWILLKVSLGAAADAAEAPADRPLVARLVPHNEIFAPTQVDQPLWSQPIDGAVVVWPINVLPPPGDTP